MSRCVMSGLAACGMLAGAAGAWALPSPSSPSSKEQAHAKFEEGYQHQTAKQYQEAIAAYEQSLSYDSNQAEALNNLGFCYKSLKRYQKAIRYYKDALRLDPNLPEAHE